MVTCVLWILWRHFPKYFCKTSIYINSHVNESFFILILTFSILTGMSPWNILLIFQGSWQFFSEAPTRGVLWKKVFLKFLQNSQENACAGVLGLRPTTLLKKRLWRRCSWGLIFEIWIRETVCLFNDFTRPHHGWHRRRKVWISGSLDCCKKIF